MLGPEMHAYVRDLHLILTSRPGRFNGSALMETALKPNLRPPRFPPPWTVGDIGGSFVVKASNDRPLVFIYYREGAGRRSLAKLLTRNTARRIAADIEIG